MGMYTEITAEFDLKEDTPQQVIQTLQYMCSHDGPETFEVPDHELFKTERWRMLFTCDSAYFDSWRRPVIEKKDNGRYHLDVCANLKNYDSEIDKFFDWIHPYVYTGDERSAHIGTSRYEEFKHEPTEYYIEDGELVDRVYI